MLTVPHKLDAYGHIVVVLCCSKFSGNATKNQQDGDLFLANSVTPEISRNPDASSPCQVGRDVAHGLTTRVSRGRLPAL